MSQQFSHFDPTGAARIVDISEKPETKRVARAVASIQMQPSTAQLIRGGSVGKGDVLGIARLAGIMAVKRTADLIPLCHPIRLSHVEIEFDWRNDTELGISATTVAFDRTGVEMESLVAATVASLTVYDMCKSHDRWMTISKVQLHEKSGGKSGNIVREESQQ